MKRFIARLSIEFIVIATTTIVATQLVKSGYLALGVSILSIYAKVVYKIDAPGRGRIVIYLPIEKDAKNEDAPAASNKG